MADRESDAYELLLEDADRLIAKGGSASRAFAAMQGSGMSPDEAREEIVRALVICRQKEWQGIALDIDVVMGRLESGERAADIED
jgi:hypothetical protein